MTKKEIKKKQNKEIRLKDEINLDKYFYSENIYNKILNLDQPLYFSPIAVKNALRRMKEDEDYGNEELLELAEKTYKKWSKFHEIFKDFLFNSISSSDKMLSFNEFKLNLISIYISDPDFQPVFLKISDYLKKNDNFPEINGNNLGSSFDYPDGRGSNYFKLVFYEIYKMTWGYNDNVKKHNFEDELISKLKNKLMFETNFYFVSTRSMSDSISDIFFTINETEFREYSNKIFELNNVEFQKRKISKWFNIRNKIESANFDFNYIYPFMFLRSVDYLSNFAAREISNDIEESKPTEEKIEIVTKIDFENFIKRFDVVKSEEDENSRIEVADKAELEKVKESLKIMENDGIYTIQDLRKEVLDLLRKSSPKHEVELFKKELDCEFVSEDFITRKIYDVINYPESIFKSTFNVNDQTSDSRPDIVLEAKVNGKPNIWNSLEGVLEETIDKINSGLKQLDASIVSDLAGNQLFCNIKTTRNTCYEIYRNKFLRESNAAIYIEAKILDKKEFSNLVFSNVSKSESQRNSYIRREAKRNELIESIGINYLSLRELDKLINENEKEVAKNDSLEIPEEIKEQKRIRLENKVKLLNEIKRNGYYFNNKTYDLVYVFDCKNPSMHK